MLGCLNVSHLNEEYHKGWRVEGEDGTVVVLVGVSAYSSESA